MIIDVYTDGGCRPCNPGPGGYSAVFYKEGKLLDSISGGEIETTNNRMELTGVLTAIKTIASFPKSHDYTTFNIYSDSSYVINGINSWLANWKLKGWIGSNKQPVKNQDLWQEIDSFLTPELKAIINFKWVKGHSGIKGNEMADKLATEAIPK